MDLHLDLGHRVFSNRERALAEGALPAAIVYTLRETEEIWQEAPRIYKRKLELVIELAAARKAPADGAKDLDGSGDDLDDYLDGLVLEIEKRFERDPTLGGLVEDLQHVRFEYEPAREGALRIGFARMIEEVEYFTEAPEEPEYGLAPLREISLDVRPTS